MDFQFAMSKPWVGQVMGSVLSPGQRSQIIDKNGCKVCCRSNRKMQPWLPRALCMSESAWSSRLLSWHSTVPRRRNSVFQRPPHLPVQGQKNANALRGWMLPVVEQAGCDLLFPFNIYTGFYLPLLHCFILFQAPRAGPLPSDGSIPRQAVSVRQESAPAQLIPLLIGKSLQVILKQYSGN